MEIKEVSEKETKAEICNHILRALPDWFGIEESIVGYTNEVRKLPFYVALEKEQRIGFLAIKIHNPYTAEICVMGVTNEYHRQGVGSALVIAAEKFCKNRGFQFLTVKTLDGSVQFEPYERTRNFYNKMGFVPLEVFPLLWDAANPCLFLAKYLH